MSTSTKKFAVLGSPIAHSRSPLLHRAWYAHANIAASYEAIECTDIAATMPSLLKFAGLSVTMPLKEQAYAVAQVSDIGAQRTGAANTLIRTGNGWSGHNTDVLGIEDIFEANGISRIPSATVIGAGATARSAVLALDGIAERIVVVSRDRHRSADAVEMSDKAQWVPWADAAEELGSDVVIATTPAHVTDDLAGWGQQMHGLLIDVVYSPWPTALAAAWSGPVLGGLELLARQAARQIELFFPGSDPHEAYAVMIEAASGA